MLKHLLNILVGGLTACVFSILMAAIMMDLRFLLILAIPIFAGVFWLIGDSVLESFGK